MLFKRAGVDPAVMRDPRGRFRDRQLEALWQLSLEQTQDPCFGLKVCSYWQPTTFHALGYAWLASRTLSKGIDRLTRYFRVATTAAAPELCELRDAYKFNFVLLDDLPFITALVDAAYGTIVKMCRMSRGADFRPERVSYDRPADCCVTERAKFYQAPITYDAAEHGIYINKGDMTGLLPGANVELAKISDQAIHHYLDGLDNTDLVSRLKALLVERLPSGEVTGEDAAHELGLNHRTFQRKLVDSGTSLKEILEDTRRQLAVRYLTDDDLSLAEISYLCPVSTILAGRRLVGHSYDRTTSNGRFYRRATTGERVLGRFY